LIDTGNSSHFDKEVIVYPFWLRLKLKSLAGELKPKVRCRVCCSVSAKTQQAALAILSHVHLDHAAGS